MALISDVGEAKVLLDQADMLSHYARRIKADTEITNAIQYGKLKIVARIGELDPAIPPEGRGRGNKKNGSPGELFFAKASVAKFRKVTSNIAKLDDYREKCGGEEELTLSGFVRFATGTEKAGTAAHVSASTGVPEWYTPAEYIEAARAVLGAIDLDPASSAAAQKTVKAARYYTVDDDGLSREWAGRVWLNPPYSTDLVAKFVAKPRGGLHLPSWPIWASPRTSPLTRRPWPTWRSRPRS